LTSKKKTKKLQDPLFLNLKTFETNCFACELEVGEKEMTNFETLEYETKLKLVISNLKKSIKEENKEKENLENGGFHYQYTAQSKKKKKKKSSNIYELLSMNTLKPKFENNEISKIRGLMNLGNTCFFNSVLQSFTQTRKISSFYLDVENLRNEKETLQSTLYAGNLSASLWLYFVQYYTLEDQTLNPSFLFDQICKKNDQFSSYQQQDAQVSLFFLLLTQGIVENTRRFHTNGVRREFNSKTNY
jgi:ubiquitin C-terminal hydrolase